MSEDLSRVKSVAPPSVMLTVTSSEGWVARATVNDSLSDSVISMREGETSRPATTFLPPVDPVVVVIDTWPISRVVASAAGTQ